MRGAARSGGTHLLLTRHKRPTTSTERAEDQMRSVRSGVPAKARGVWRESDVKRSKSGDVKSARRSIIPVESGGYIDGGCYEVVTRWLSGSRFAWCWLVRWSNAPELNGLKLGPPQAGVGCIGVYSYERVGVWSGGVPYRAPCPGGSQLEAASNGIASDARCWSGVASSDSTAASAAASSMAVALLTG